MHGLGEQRGKLTCLNRLNDYFKCDKIYYYFYCPYNKKTAVSYFNSDVYYNY